MDDLVKRLRSQIGDDVQEIYSHEALFKLAAARIEELEAERDAFVAEAARQAYSIGVYDQQNSTEKLDPAKTFPISGAATIARIAQEGKE